MSGVLVVAAHPDDEVLGCGATMAKATAAGIPVHVAILGEGATSRVSDRASGDTEDVAALVESAQAAGKVMGVDSVTVLGLPDNRFDSVDLLDVVKLVEAEIEEHRPSIVYTQHGGDVNVDHRCTYQAVLAATRPVPGHPVQEVLAFPVGSSTDWAFQRNAPRFTPTVFVDVTDTIDTKVDAMACYPDEMRPFPHPRSPEALRATAAHWGSAVGVAAAEPFEPVRMIR